MGGDNLEETGNRKAETGNFRNRRGGNRKPETRTARKNKTAERMSFNFQSMDSRFDLAVSGLRFLVSGIETPVSKNACDI
jgi:hypothetical protein